MRRWSAVLGGVMGAVLQSGCAVNGSGLVAGRVHLTDSAVVTRLHTLGAALRTVRGDAGAALGYSRRTYVHPRSPSSPVPGWYLLRVPLSESPPVALHGRTLGLALDANGARVSATAGLVDSTVVRAVPGPDGGVVVIDLQPERPEQTTLDYCDFGGAKCDHLVR